MNCSVIATLALSVALISCENIHEEVDKKFTITFNSNGGSEVDAQIVAKGGKVIVPEEPTRDGSRFDCWYKDNNIFADAWNFGAEIVTTDISLYARWIFNNNNHTFKPSALQKILDGYVICAINFDSKGNAWVGTFQQGIIRYNVKEMIVYHSDNSIIPKDFIAYDISVDKNDNIWIGGYGGLFKYDGQDLMLYNAQNSPMPVSFVKSVVVDSKNNVWLVSYNCLIKISNDKLRVYDEKDLGFKPYNIGNIQFDSKNQLWGVIDYSHFSSTISNIPDFFIFDGEKITLLLCYNNNIFMMPEITIDHNDYVWCYGVINTYGVG